MMCPSDCTHAYVEIENGEYSHMDCDLGMRPDQCESGWFASIRDVMRDGNPRTVREIAVALGTDKSQMRNSCTKIGMRMRVYEKQHYCTLIGTTDTMGRRVNIWKWIL